MNFKNSRLILLFSIALLLFSSLSIGNPLLSTSLPVAAQFDSDNDGVSNEIDECPETPGSGEFGCPVDSDGDGINDTNDVCPDTFGEGEFGCPDADGDGLTTRQDRCPTQPGPRENAGCPVEEPEQPPTDTPQPATEPPSLPVLPQDGACVLATDGRFEVNVRAEPDENADVISILEPQNIYNVDAISDDDTWYRVEGLGGWVAARVVRTGGNCQFAAATEEPAETGLLDCPDVGDVDALPVYVQNALADNDNPCEDAADILQESVFGQPGIRHLPDETGDQMENNCPALLDDANLRLARLRQYDRALYHQTIERIRSAANPCETTRNIPAAPEIGAVWCMPHFDDTDIVHLSERTQGYIDDFGGEVNGCADIYSVQELGDLTPEQREFAGELLPACDIQSYTRVLELISTAMSVNADFEDVLGDNRVCVGLDPAQVILDYEQPAPPDDASPLPPEFIGCPMLGKQIRNHNDDLTPIALLSIVKSRNPCDAGREYIATGRVPTLPDNISDSLNECLSQSQRDQIQNLISDSTGRTLANTVIPVAFSDQDVISMENLSPDAAMPANWLANASTSWAVKLAMMPTSSDDACDTSLTPELPEFVCTHFITKQYQNLSQEDPISVEARLVYYGIDSSGNRQIASAASQWTSIVLPPTGSGGAAFGTMTQDRRPQYDFMVQTRVLTLGGQPVPASDYTTTGTHQIIVGRSAQCEDNLPEPDTDLAATGQICVRYQGHFGNYGELTAPARVTLGYEGQPRTNHIHETPIQEVYIPANGYGATMIFTVQIAERPGRSVQAFYHMYPGDNVQNISERIETVPMSNCDDDFTPLPDEGTPAATESATPTPAPMQPLSGEAEPSQTPQTGTPPREEYEYCLFFTELEADYVEDDKGTETFRVRVFYNDDLKNEAVDDITNEASYNPAAGLDFVIPSYGVTVLAADRNAIFSNLDYKYRLHIQRDSIFKGNDTLKGQVLNISTSGIRTLSRTGGEIRVFRRNDENAPEDCEWQTPATDDPTGDDRDQGILDCGRSEPFGLLDERGDVHEYSYNASAGDEFEITLRTEETSPIIPALTSLNLIDPDGNSIAERTIDNRNNPNQTRSVQYTVQTGGWYTIRIQASGAFVFYTEPEANTKWNYVFTFDCEKGALQGQSGTLSNVGGVTGLPQLDISGIGSLQDQQDILSGFQRRCVAFYSEIINNSSSDTRADVQLVAEDESGNATIVSQAYSRTIPAGSTQSINFEETVVLFSGQQLSAQFSGQGIRYDQWTLNFQGSGSDCSDNQLPGQQQGQQQGQQSQTGQPGQQPAGGASPASQANLSNQNLPSASEQPPADAQQIVQPGRNLQRVNTDLDFFSGNLAAVGTDAEGVLYGISNGVATPLFDNQPHERITAPALSPDGSKVVYTGIDGDTRGLYVTNIERSIEAPIDIGERSLTDNQPVWSADSERLLVTLETTDGQTTIYELTFDDPIEITNPLIENASQPTLASDDSYLLFTRDNDIFSRSTDSGNIVQVTDNEMRCGSPVVDRNEITAYIVCDGLPYRYDISGLQALDIPRTLTGLRAGSETGRIALYDNQKRVVLYDARQSQTYMTGLDVSLIQIDWR